MVPWHWRALGVFLALSTLVLAGCGPSSPPATATATATVRPSATPAPLPTATPTPAPTATPTPTPDPWAEVTPAPQIVVWHAITTKGQAQALGDLAAEFSKTNPWGIQVEVVGTGTATESLAKTKQAITDGTPPDVVIAYPSSLADYARLEALMPLEPLFTHPRYGLAAAGQTDFVIASVGDVYPHAGYQVLSFPLGRRIWLMYANLTLLQQLGFETLPATWDELKTQCAAAQAQGLKCLAIAPDASLVEAQIWSRGGELLDERGELTLGEQAGQAAFAFYAELVQAGYAYRAGDNFGEQKDFGAQKTLFTFGTSASLSYYEKEVKGRFSWGVGPFPSGGAAPVVVTYGYSAGILAPYPPQQLAAWLFLRWLHEADPATRWAAASGYLPLRRSAWETARADETLSAIPHLAEAWATLAYAREEPAVDGWGGVRKTLEAALSALLDGQSPEVTWEQALNEARRSVRP